MKLKQVIAGVLGAVLVSGAVSANIAGEKSVAVPLVMSIEGDRLLTSACIPVIRKLYRDDGVQPWGEFRRDAKRGPEWALVRTIEAIQGRNKSSLVDITHPQLGRDPQQLPMQMDALMRQFETLGLRGVEGYLKFDNYLVFSVELEYRDKPLKVDFTYALDESGDYRFLPYRTPDLAFRAVMNWARSSYGMLRADAAVYCGNGPGVHGNLRIPLDAVDKYNRKATALIAEGASLTDAAAADRYAGITGLLDRLKKMIQARDFDAFVAGLTEDGAKRLRQWLATANEEDLAQYAGYMLDQKPFYVIDADPFYVLYVQTQAHGVRSLFFTRDERSGEYRWANASYATPLDRIFKQDMVVRAASEAEPFADWKN